MQNEMIPAYLSLELPLKNILTSDVPRSVIQIKTGCRYVEKTLVPPAQTWQARVRSKKRSSREYFFFRTIKPIKSRIGNATIQIIKKINPLMI